MSQKNSSEARRTARERMQEERAAQEAKAKRLRKFGIIGTVLAVIVVAVVIGVLVQNGRTSSYDAATQAPAGTIGTNKLIIPVGSTAAPSTLTVYEDLRCPACGSYEKSFHTTVNQLLAAGKIQVQYHVVSFIDRNDNGTGSKNAANAVACAQNVGKFHGYHDVLYANQPDETDDAWADKSKLITLAKQVPGLDTPTFESCVNNNSFGPWATAVQKDFDKSGHTSTPTILLNGTSAYPTYNGEQISTANLIKWVDAANKGKTPASLAPSASAALVSPNASPSASG